MTNAKDHITAIMNTAQEQCFAIYVEEARRVLRKCPRLDYLVAAMGSAFWVDRHGGSMGDDPRDGTPATALRFLTDIDEAYYEAFRSPGVKIYRDRIVTDW